MSQEPRRARVGRPASTPSERQVRNRRIALVALTLFESQGVSATTAAQIADQAGISTRSFWRYFVAKEEAVAPLLEEGLADAVERLGRVARGQSFADAWADPSVSEAAEVDAVVRLLQLANREPTVNAVWQRVHYEAARALASAIARHEGADEESLEVRVRAAVLNAALFVAIEHYAAQTTPSRSISEVVADAVRIAGG